MLLGACHQAPNPVSAADVPGVDPQLLNCLLYTSGNKSQVFQEIRSQNAFHMIIPTLAKNADHRGIGSQKRFDVLVLIRRHSFAAGGAKRSQLCVMKLQSTGPLKKHRVLLIGGRIARLNIMAVSYTHLDVYKRQGREYPGR